MGCMGGALVAGAGVKCASVALWLKNNDSYRGSPFKWRGAQALAGEGRRGMSGMMYEIMNSNEEHLFLSMRCSFARG